MAKCKKTESLHIQTRTVHVKLTKPVEIAVFLKLKRSINIVKQNRSRYNSRYTNKKKKYATKKSINEKQTKKNNNNKYTALQVYRSWKMYKLFVAATAIMLSRGCHAACKIFRLKSNESADTSSRPFFFLPPPNAIFFDLIT